MPDPIVTEKPKPRRRKAKRPAADPTTPKKPRVTLLSRIEAMGPTHVAAYRFLAQGNPAFAVEFSAALRAEENLSRAKGRATHAAEQARIADVFLRRAEDRMETARAVIARLDTLARQIATARGDVPAIDDANAAPVAPAPDAD